MFDENIMEVKIESNRQISQYNEKEPNLICASYICCVDDVYTDLFSYA